MGSKRNRKGFSLVELMVAAVVLSVLMTTSGISLVHVAKKRSEYRARCAALILANAKLEQAYGLVNQATFTDSGLTSGFLDDGMVLHAGNPNLTWEYDDVTLDRSVLVTNDAPFALIQSRVVYRDNFAVTLNTKKYLE
ncbi:MAG: prepilin-type N-terminal cleavage/methylation domain-containing protein [Pontiellaceae bacterium]|jgi:prepilin-type N-terminal cleavage/methylation domain-containing protein|nr:prepilin-type N-terminal cleavage/methylation domain-containing protein [Pontiellaceae bacterium]